MNRLVLVLLCRQVLQLSRHTEFHCFRESPNDAFCKSASIHAYSTLIQCSSMSSIHRSPIAMCFHAQSLIFFNTNMPLFPKHKHMHVHICQNFRLFIIHLLYTGNCPKISSGIQLKERKLGIDRFTIEEGSKCCLY